MCHVFLTYYSYSSTVQWFAQLTENLNADVVCPEYCSVNKGKHLLVFIALVIKWFPMFESIRIKLDIRLQNEIVE